MKNTKRMLAVIAASGLALGAMPGVANAQGTGSAELGVNLGAALGSGELALDLGLALGSEAADLPTLEDLPTGSSELDFGSITEGSTGENAPDFGSITEGSTGENAPDFGSITEGSTGENAPDFGSITEGSTNADGDLDFGSLGSITDSNAFDSLSAGSTDADGDLDFGSITEGSTGENAPDFGSITEGSTGENAPDFGSITEGSTGENAPDFGSIFAGSTDTEGNLDLGSLSPDAGSLEDILEDITSGSEAGSSEILDIFRTGSSNLGSNVLVQGSAGENGSLESEDIMTLGSIAAVSIGIGLAVQGGVNLPPLPEVNLGFVCQFPQPAIDFLKNNGSMEQDECLPEEQN